MSRLRGFLVGIAAVAILGLPGALPARAAPVVQRQSTDLSVWQSLRAQLAALVAFIAPGDAEESSGSADGSAEPAPEEGGEGDSGPKVDPDG